MGPSSTPRASRADAIAFWRAEFPSGVPLVELPTDRARPLEPSRPVGSHEFALKEDDFAALESALGGAVSREESWLSLLAALVVRYTELDEIVLARGDERIEEGGASLLHICVGADDSFEALAVRVAEKGREGERHAVMTLDALLQEIGSTTAAAEEPDVRVGFGNGGNGVDRPLDLALVVESSRGGGAARLDYDPDLFDAETIERMAGHLGMLLGAAAAGPRSRLADLDLLTPEERSTMLDAWNATETPFPDRSCLHELFEARCREQPDAPAAVFREETLTYAELDRRANALAASLRAMGVGPDVPVGICVERSLDAVVGLLGISKAGGAYVPIDPAYPSDRIEFMLADTAVPVLLTQRRLVADLPPHGARVVCLDEELPDVDGRDGGEKKPTPENLAYVIFTSGSTGKPKGVMVDHRGRVNNFTDFNRRYSIGPGDRLLALSSLSFDMSAYDCFGTLAAGATIVIPEPEEKLDPVAWARLAAEHRITVWHSVPALLEMMVDQAEGRPELHPRALRLVLLGGDWIPLTLPDRIRAICDDVHVVSMGGATECSMDSTIFDVGEIEPHWKSIPYGFPMANQRTYVLDRLGHPAPVGVPGELLLGGIGVGRGYLNRPELSAEKFVDNPFVPGEKMYRTGDLARFRPDGNLELLGRIDFQVKIRGFRVELGEIESATRRHEAVKECVVLARADPYGDKRLVGYVVTDPGVETPPRLAQELRTHLADALPDYMVPSAFVILDAFPLTPNGKINRRALPEPDAARRDLDHAAVAAETALEEVLAELYGEVLGLDAPGVTDGFAELGGSSLLANQVAARIRELFEIDVPLTEVFTRDVRSLAKLMSEKGADGGRDPNAIAEVLLEVIDDDETDDDAS